MTFISANACLVHGIPAFVDVIASIIVVTSLDMRRNSSFVDSGSRRISLFLKLSALFHLAHAFGEGRYHVCRSK